ncbi:unnamed protein product [Spodoptera exigua]|nr:unnamed protein product [Spodoptera exigua]
MVVQDSGLHVLTCKYLMVWASLPSVYDGVILGKLHTIFHLSQQSSMIYNDAARDPLL